MENCCSPGCRLWCLWWCLFCAVPFPMRCLGWDLELNWVSFWGFIFLLLENSCQNIAFLYLRMQWSIMFNQVFQRKTLVIKMRNVRGRAVGRVSTIGFRSIHPQLFEISGWYLVGNIERVNAECRIQKCQLCLSSFSSYVPWSTFFFHFGFRSYTSQPVEILFYWCCCVFVLRRR